MILAQVIVIALWISRIFIHALNDGKPIPPAKYSVLKALASAGMDAALLYYGGFFDCLLGRLP